MQPALQSLDPNLLRGLRDHVHEKLRQAIIAGELPTGAALNERRVAAELGVSTTPVKEALRRLELEGLIRTEPRRGIRVTFDAAQAQEMALARAALESMIARQAAVRISPEWLNELRGIAEQMRQATKDGAVRRLIALNETFHETIHAASGCQYLQRLLAGQLVYDKATRKFLLNDPAERRRALAEHLSILAALEARDEDRAERAMRDHVVRSGRQHVEAAFARREE